jgi:hypothetical protein
MHYASMVVTYTTRVAWFGSPNIVSVRGSVGKILQATIPSSVVASLEQSVVVRYPLR